MIFLREARVTTCRVIVRLAFAVCGTTGPLTCSGDFRCQGRFSIPLYIPHINIIYEIYIYIDLRIECLNILLILGLCSFFLSIFLQQKHHSCLDFLYFSMSKSVKFRCQNSTQPPHLAGIFIATRCIWQRCMLHLRATGNMDWTVETFIMFNGLLWINGGSLWIIVYWIINYMYYMFGD